MFKCACVCLLSHFSRVQLFVALWTVTGHASVSTGFSRQEGILEYRNPCLPPADSPNPRIESASLEVPVFQTDSTAEHREVQKL